MDVLRSLNEMDKEEIVHYVVSCQHPNGTLPGLSPLEGGFGGNVEHDPHLLYTLSAVQILAMLDAINSIDVEGVVRCILKRKSPLTVQL